jgi:hypothetical protein
LFVRVCGACISAVKLAVAIRVNFKCTAAAMTRAARFVEIQRAGVEAVLDTVPITINVLVLSVAAQRNTELTTLG